MLELEGDMCTHTLANYVMISPISPLCLMATRYITLRFLLFPCFHIGSETQFSISMMKLGGHGG